MSAQRFDLAIEGMHCGGCTRRVTAALGKLPGVTTESVVVGRASGTFDPSLTDLEAVRRAIVATGFTPEAAGGPGPADRG